MSGVKEKTGIFRKIKEVTTMRIKVANYAVNDLLYALECSGVDEISCTKEDNDLIIIYKPQPNFTKNKRYTTAATVVRGDATL